MRIYINLIAIFPEGFRIMALALIPAGYGEALYVSTALLNVFPTWLNVFSTWLNVSTTWLNVSATLLNVSTTFSP